MDLIIISIAIGFGILQIVLFFKVWDMTDNIKKIVVFLKKQNPFWEYANQAYLMGNKPVLLKQLEKAFTFECKRDLLDKGRLGYLNTFKEREDSFIEICARSFDIEPDFDMSKYKDPLNLRYLF